MGLEACTVHPKAITTKEFMEFVEMLSAKFRRQVFAIFMDNLQVHNTKKGARDVQAPEGAADLQRALQPGLQRHQDLLLAPEGREQEAPPEGLLMGAKVDSSSLIIQSIQRVEQDKIKRCVAADLGCIRTQA